MQDEENRAIRFRSQGISTHELEIVPNRYGWILQHHPNLYLNKYVVDVGCGFGAGCKYIEGKGATKIVGIDANDTDLGLAKEKYSSPIIEYIKAFGWEIPLPSDSVEVVTNVECIEHNDFEERDLMLKEIHRILQPSGILMITTPNKREFLTFPSGSHFMEYKPDELISIVEKFGFKNISVNPTIGNDSMCLLFEKV